MKSGFRVRRQGLALIGGGVAILLGLLFLWGLSPSSSRGKQLSIREANAALVAASSRYSTATKRHQRIQNLADDAGLSDTMIAKTVTGASGRLKDIEFVRKLQASVDLTYAKLIEAATESVGRYSDELVAREAWAKVSLSGIEGTFVKRSDVLIDGARRMEFDLMVRPEDVEESKDALQNTAVARIELHPEGELISRVMSALESTGFENRRYSRRSRLPKRAGSFVVFVRASQRADAVQMLRARIGQVFDRNLIEAE